MNEYMYMQWLVPHDNIWTMLISIIRYFKAYSNYILFRDDQFDRVHWQYHRSVLNWILVSSLIDTDDKKSFWLNGRSQNGTHNHMISYYSYGQGFIMILLNWSICGLIYVPVHMYVVCMMSTWMWKTKLKLFHILCKSVINVSNSQSNGPMFDSC